jgi:hypothetical protein
MPTFDQRNINGDEPGRECKSWTEWPRAGETWLILRRSGLGGEVDGVLASHGVFPEAGLVGIPGHLSWAEVSHILFVQSSPDRIGIRELI